MIYILYYISGDVHAHVCASRQNVHTNGQLKRHMKQQHCDDVTMERQKKFFFPFNCNEGPFRTSGDITQHTTAI